MVKAILILLIFLQVISVSCTEKDPVLRPSSPLPDHPRILLLKGEEADAKINIKNDSEWIRIYDLIFKECYSIINTEPVQRVLIGKRLLDKSQEALRRVFYLSFAYRFSGNKIFLERAEKEMLAVSDFTDWNPSHFLDVAEMTMACAIGYDWLYESLSSASRTKIRDAIISKGLNPSFSSSNNWFVNSNNNWNQVCNAGMTLGALAIYEDDSLLAKKVISRAESSILIAMKEYQPDGAYPEGYGYWGYGTSFNIMFISVWEKVFGREFTASQSPAFLKTGSYLENMSGPAGFCFNYSDCGSGTSLHPAMFWFADKTGKPSLLWEERKFLSKVTSAKERLLPAILIWSAGLKTSDITEPASKFWMGHGINPVALMRTSWSDPNAIYLGLKAGTPKANHGHMDVGSFVMESGGVRWAQDLGSQDYNSLEQAGVDLWNMSQNSQRWKVFRYNNLAHNTLSVNDQMQIVGGMADIIASSSNPEMMHAVTDLSGVYLTQLKSAVRGVAIVAGRFVVVRDEIETGESGATVRWNMVTPAVVTITGNNTAELVKNGKKLELKVSEPANITMKIWSATSSNSFDAPNPGTVMVGFEAVVPANTKTAIQVFLLPDFITPDPLTIPGPLNTWAQ